MKNLFTSLNNLLKQYKEQEKVNETEDRFLSRDIKEVERMINNFPVYFKLEKDNK